MEWSGDGPSQTKQSLHEIKMDIYFYGILQAEILQGSFTGSCLEYPSLNNGDALEVLHGLDPSILSIFEDNPTGEVNKA